jgi:hypothetical protein
LVKRREFRMGELIANEEYAAKNIRLALDPHQAKLSSPRQSPNSTGAALRSHFIPGGLPVLAPSRALSTLLFPGTN